MPAAHFPRTLKTGSPVSGKNFARKLAEQTCRHHTPRYRTGMRVYVNEFPRNFLELRLSEVQLIEGRINNTMTTVHKRIKDGIDLHRRLTGDDPDIVVLSEAAHKNFLYEGLDEGSRPYSLASDAPATVPSGEIGAVDGVPIRTLPDMPGDYVGVVYGV